MSRYGRLQDTIADKLLPRWLRALAERPGSQIEVLNRAEQLGVLEDVSQWLEARQLRNTLIHEYMEDSATFAEKHPTSRTVQPPAAGNLPTHTQRCRHALKHRPA